MPSLLAVILWYVFLALVILAVQRMTRCFTQLNIFTLFFAFLLMRHGITGPFDDNLNPAMLNITLGDEALLRFYTSLILMYTLLVAGIYVGRKLFGSGQIDEKKFQSELRPGRLPHGINPPVFLAVVVLAMAVVILQTWTTGINLGELFSGQLSSLEYRAAREEFGLATSSGAGPLNRLAAVARLGLFPLLIATLYFLKEYGWLWRGLFLGVLGVGLVTGLISGQKSPALYLALGLAVAVYMRRGQLKMQITDFRIWLLGAAGLFLVIPYLYSLQYPTMDYATRLNLTLYRLSSEADRSLQLYFNVYPDIHPFMDGTSSTALNSLLGREIDADEIPERFIPIYYQGATYLSTWNAAFVGTAWADFGYWGVVLESILVGLMLQWYASWFARAQKTALVLGTQVGLIMAAIRLSEVSLTAGMLTYGMVSCFLLYLLVKSYHRYPRAAAPPDLVASPPGQNVTID